MFFKLVSRLILVCTVIFLFWVTKQSPTWFMEQTVGVTEWIFQITIAHPKL